MLHEELWDANMDLARACLDHPFVRGLGDGSLEQAAFRRYVAQDAFFLRAFLRAYAVAGAKCSNIDHVMKFHEFQAGVIEELKLHSDYAEDLRIDLSEVQPLPPTRAYLDSLLAHAWHSPPDVTLAAMTPCMRLYSYLGSALAKTTVNDNPYEDWIETYSGEDFRESAAEVEELLDALAEDSPAVRNAYRYAMECELAFFDAPLEKPA